MSFRRPTLIAALALGLVAGPARAEDAAKATGAPSPSTAPRSEECSSEHERQHMLGAVLDAGQGPASYGARYLESYRSSSGCGGLGFTGWYALGGEVRGEGTSAAAAQVVGRFGGIGDTMGFGIELAAGGGTTFARTIATGQFAVLLDFYYLGFGISYAFPIGFDRPAWLASSVEFALRIHVPLFTYDEYEERHATIPK